jgi:hypothetical protein
VARLGNAPISATEASIAENGSLGALPGFRILHDLSATPAGTPSSRHEVAPSSCQ